MNLPWHLRSASIKIAIWLLKSTGWYEGHWNRWQTMFAYAERKGLHILPVHYYSPIPNTRDLPEEIWQRLRPPIGFDLRIGAALNWLNQLGKKYDKELRALPVERSSNVHSFYLNNEAFKSGDAEILYTIVRDLKPRRIVEIGSGYSTLLTCNAIRENQAEVSNYRCEFVSVEPYPSLFLTPPPPEVTRLESMPLQQVNLDLFSALQENDILFIDSTHVARIGSDVLYEYLTILPNLAPGVVVHIHDIFIPAEYPRLWIHESRLFWNEQYLLEAFLTFNPEFEVIMPVHAAWRLHREAFCRALPSFKVGTLAPSSFWIRRRHPG